MKAEKAIEIIGVNLMAIKKIYHKKLKETFQICDSNIRERNWRLKETGDRFFFDDEILQYEFGLEVTKETFYRQLKNNRAPLGIVLEVNEFCIEHLYKQQTTNNQPHPNYE